MTQPASAWCQDWLAAPRVLGSLRAIVAGPRHRQRRAKPSGSMLHLACNTPAGGSDAWARTNLDDGPSPAQTLTCATPLLHTDVKSKAI